MRKLLALSAALFIVAVSQNSYALINSGFETGDFTGWTSSPGVGALVMHWATPDMIPGCGEHYALLGGYAAPTLSQTFDILSGSGVDGWAASNAGGDAWVKIFDSSSAVVYTFTPPSDWYYWSWIASVTGTYTVQYGVTGTGHCAMFDAKDSGVVPEPATMSLLGFSLLGVWGMRRKRA